jgi:hypothetical protein
MRLVMRIFFGRGKTLRGRHDQYAVHTCS